MSEKNTLMRLYIFVFVVDVLQEVIPVKWLIYLQLYSNNKHNKEKNRHLYRV